MKKGRDFMKRKRLLSAMLAGIFAVSMLGGCASAVPQGATETTQGSAQETDKMCIRDSRRTGPHRKVNVH